MSVSNVCPVNELSSYKTSCAACIRADRICPRPLQVVTNRHPELSGWKSTRRSGMRVIVLLVTLTFNPSTSKWVHGSPVLWASFLLNFSFLYVLLSSTQGQARDRRTCRHTTAINALCPQPMGAGHNNSILFCCTAYEQMHSRKFRYREMSQSVQI